MKHSPSWEANSCLASQITRILWNLRWQKPATGFILSHFSPVKIQHGFTWFLWVCQNRVVKYLDTEHMKYAANKNFIMLVVTLNYNVMKCACSTDSGNTCGHTFAANSAHTAKAGCTWLVHVNACRSTVQYKCTALIKSGVPAHLENEKEERRMATEAGWGNINWNVALDWRASMVTCYFLTLSWQLEYIMSCWRCSPQPGMTSIVTSLADCC